MGQQAGNVQQGMMALGQTLAGGNGLGYLANQAQERSRIEQAGADRVLRNYQLQQAQEADRVNNVRNNFQRQQEIAARAGQFDKEYEQRERAQQHGMGLDTSKLALAQRGQLFDEGAKNRQLSLAEQGQAFDQGIAGRGMGIKEQDTLFGQQATLLKLAQDQDQFGKTHGLAQRRLEEVDAPYSAARVASAMSPRSATVSLRQMAVADPKTYQLAKEEAFEQFDDEATDEDIMAIMVQMQRGGTPAVKPKPNLMPADFVKRVIGGQQ